MAYTKGAPYLSDLRSQLGRSFAESISVEVDRYKQYRQKLKELAEDDDQPTQKRKKAAQRLKSLPPGMRYSSAELIGPPTLPRGQTTPLPATVFGTKGQRWQLAALIVHTDPGGRWELVGYKSSRGKPTPIKAEVRTYQEDDLGQAVHYADDVIDQVSRVATRYLAYAQEAHGGGNPLQQMSFSSTGSMVASVGEDDEFDIDEDDTTTSSGLAKLQQNATTALGSSSSSSTVEGQNLKPKQILRRLTHRNDKPRWYKKLKMSKRGRKLLRKFILNGKGAKLFRIAAKRDWTYKKMWAALRKYLDKREGMTGDCSVRPKSGFDTTSSGKCPFRKQCSRYEKGAGGFCEHLGVKKTRSHLSSSSYF